MKLKLRTVRRITSLVLTVTVFATSVRAEEYATLVNEAVSSESLETEALEAKTDNAVNQTEDEIPKAYVLYEDETLREESVKHFAMSDGTMKAVVYSEPVHFEEDGLMLDIDSTLTEVSSDALSLKGIKTEEKWYKNKAGEMDIYLAKDAGSSKLAFIEKDGCMVSFEYVPYVEEETDGQGETEETEAFLSSLKALKKFNLKGNSAISKDKAAKNELKEKVKAAKELLKTIKGQIKNPAERKGDILEKAAGKTESRIRYSGVKKNCDIEYVISGNGLKENITLYEKQDSYTYTFILETEGVILIANEDGSISAVKEGTEEEIFVLPAPFMYDANEKYSDKVTQEITLNEDGTYSLTIKADEEWINSADRIFPVVIDPAVTTETTRETIDSTFITSNQPTTNHSTKLETLAGRESSEYGNCRMLVKFTLPTLKKGDMVINGALNIYNYKNGFYSSSTPDLQLNAHMVTGSWNMSTVTWNTQPSYEGTISDYMYLNRSVTGWKTLDLTKMVKAWYEGTAANNGVLIKSSVESGSYATSGVKGYFWPERYNAQTDAYPCLIVEYRNNKGLEDYWTYTGASAGRAGSAYVNDYSGNLVFVHSDVATTGMRSPVAIEHVYNGYQSGAYASTCMPYVGYGFRLNIQQRVTTTVMTDYPYMYTDGDGTEHYFRKLTENGATVYRDEDGLGLTLVRNNTGYVISDDKDNKLNFNMSGFLSSIQDNNGNTITINYNSSYFITSVKDGAGDSLTFSYAGNLLRSITDAAGRTTTFYYNGSKLVNITYPDGTVSRYGYDGYNQLVSATSPDGYKLNFVYKRTASNSQVSEICEYGGNTKGETLRFNRSTYNVTTIMSAGKDQDIASTTDNVMTELQFDNFGRTVTTRTYTSGKDFGASMYTYTAGEMNSSGTNAKQINKVATASAFGENKVNYARNHSAENGGDWGSAAWNWQGSVTHTYARSTSTAYIGKYSHCINVTACTGDSRGRIYQDYSSSILVPGKTYTVSAYVKGTNIKGNGNGTYGAAIAVNFFLKDGTNPEFVYSEFVHTTDTAINGGFKRIEATFTVPSNVNYTRLNLILRAATVNNGVKM